MAKKVSIIVLCHNRWAIARRCLESLKRATDPRLYELLVYDNASTDATAAGLRRLARGWPELCVVRNPRNIPFARAVNQGMREARGEYFLWLNNDTVLSPGWLEGLLKAAASSRDLAAVGPMTQSAAPPGQLCPPFETTPGLKLEEAPFLGGFCFLLKREGAERVGFLDERFVWGWEDMDYCLRLRQAGYGLGLARNIFVRHEGSRTISKMESGARVRSDLANRALITRKWAKTEPWGGDLAALFSRCPAPWLRPAPVVSIIVLCRGEAKRWKQCLSSVRRAAGGIPYEVLAVEAGEGLARRWSELKVLGPWGPLSAAQALNRATAAARGDFVVVVDPGTKVAPGWLAAVLEAARSQSEVGVVRPKPPQSGWLLFTRRFFQKVGGFDERFAAASCAQDLCLRLMQAGYALIEVEDKRLRRSARSRRAEPAPFIDRDLVSRKWLSPAWTDAAFQQRFWNGLVARKDLAPAVSIVVICRGRWELSKACLDSVRRCAGAMPYEVLAAALGPDGRTQKGLAALARDWPELKAVGFWDDVPYPHAVNLALRSARGGFLVILAEEACVSPGWLEGLVDAARSDAAAGVVAPGYGETGLPWQSPARGSKSASGASQVHFVRDACLLIPRPAFLSIGEFDDRFMAQLGAEDYCLRAKQRGFHVLVARDSRVSRLRAARFEGDRDGRAESWRRDLKLVFDKWIGHPLLPLVTKR